MVKIEGSITINAPVEKVFAYLDDPAHGMDFIPSITNIRDITGKEVGQKWGWTYKMMGLPLKGEAEVTGYIPNRRCVVKTTGGIISTWTFTLKAKAGGTRLHLVIEYIIPVPVLGKVGEKLVLRLNEREAAFAIANLKDKLEG